jgi:2-methylcitrate dehydratase PrpD
MGGRHHGRQGATERLAAFVCGAGPERDSGVHAEAFTRALIDTFAVGLAAFGTPVEQRVSRWALAERATGRSSMWTTGTLTSPSQAALVNATAAHALDWDDVSPGSAMHPSAVLVPALLAYGEHLGAGGPEIVVAHDVGAAVFRAVTQALPRSVHYDRGWHTTSTVGRLAAVAALSRLAGLAPEAVRRALGLGASMAAGSLANFGTMTKPLHAGLAARDAVMAVQLAQDGFTANESQLESRGGFFEVFGDEAAQHDAMGVLGGELERWRREWTRDWAQKRYPACYGTHRAIDAVLALREEVDLARVDRLEVTVEPGGLRPLLTTPPRDGTEAKFNMAYVLAVAALRGAVTLADFDDGALDDTAVRALMDRVVSVEAATPPIGDPTYDAGFTVVEARIAGERVSHRVDRTRGDSSDPLSAAEIDDKLVQGATVRGLSSEAASEVLRELHALVEADTVARAGELLSKVSNEGLVNAS